MFFFGHLLWITMNQKITFEYLNGRCGSRPGWRTQAEESANDRCRFQHKFGKRYYLSFVHEFNRFKLWTRLKGIDPFADKTIEIISVKVTPTCRWSPAPDRNTSDLIIFIPTSNSPILPSMSSYLLYMRVISMNTNHIRFKEWSYNIGKFNKRNLTTFLTNRY